MKKLLALLIALALTLSFIGCDAEQSAGAPDAPALQTAASDDGADAPDADAPTAAAPVPAPVEPEDEDAEPAPDPAEDEDEEEYTEPDYDDSDDELVEDGMLFDAPSGGAAVTDPGPSLGTDAADSSADPGPDYDAEDSSADPGPDYDAEDSSADPGPDFDADVSDVADNENVDKEAFRQIAGDYQATAEDISYFHLAILKNIDGKPYYLTMYDNAAGNPGVEGELISLDSTTLTIEIDRDYFDEMPSEKWVVDGDNLTLDWTLEGDVITFTNNGASVAFARE